MTLHLIKLLKTLPKYSKYSMKSIRKVIGWDYEHTLKDLFSILDREALKESPGEVKMTANDKKKASELLKQEDEDLRHF